MSKTITLGPAGFQSVTEPKPKPRSSSMNYKKAIASLTPENVLHDAPVIMAAMLKEAKVNLALKQIRGAVIDDLDRDRAKLTAILAEERAKDAETLNEIFAEMLAACDDILDGADKLKIRNILKGGFQRIRKRIVIEEEEGE